MHFKVLFPAFGLWLVLVALAFANGAFREFVLSPKLGAPVAHVISTVILSALIVLVTYLFVGKVKDRYSAQDMLLTGIFWTALTLVFEFGLGLARGASWETMLADYNIFKGRVWVVVPIITLLAPSIMYRLIKK